MLFLSQFQQNLKDVRLLREDLWHLSIPMQHSETSLIMDTIGTELKCPLLSVHKIDIQTLSLKSSF